MPVNNSNVNILYWNCHGNDGENFFQKVFFDMLREYDVDIFCLDESVADIKDFIINLNSSLLKYKFIKEGLSNGSHGRLRVYSRVSKYNFTKQKVSKRFVKLCFKKRFDLCFVHFKSMARTDERDKMDEDIKTINEIYKSKKYEKKFLIGDFNATPYSQTMLDSRCLNTVRIKENEFEIKRKDLSKYKRINPSWSFFLENNNGIYGTHQRNMITNDNIGLQLFDQVVFDDGLQTFYSPNSFKIISSVKGEDLLNKYLECEQSDHLPIFFSLINL